jgi:hypothetical protein
MAVLRTKASRCQLEAAGEVLTDRGKATGVVHPALIGLAIWVSIPISGIPQRTSYVDFDATGVTARFDGTVHGRMYSGPVCSCARLTMRAPVWYPISPGP